MCHRQEIKRAGNCTKKASANARKCTQYVNSNAGYCTQYSNTGNHTRYANARRRTYFGHQR